MKQLIFSSLQKSSKIQLLIVLSTMIFKIYSASSCPLDNPIQKDDECISKCGSFPNYYFVPTNNSCVASCTSAEYVLVPEDSPILFTKRITNLSSSKYKDLFLRKNNKNNNIFISNANDIHITTDVKLSFYSSFNFNVKETKTINSNFPFYNYYEYNGNMNDYISYVDPSSKNITLCYLKNTTCSILEFTTDLTTEFAGYESENFLFASLSFLMVYQGSNYYQFLSKHYNIITGTGNSYLNDPMSPSFKFKIYYIHNKYWIWYFYDYFDDRLDFWMYNFNSTYYDWDSEISKDIDFTDHYEVIDYKSSWLTNSVNNANLAINCVMLLVNDKYEIRCIWFYERNQYFPNSFETIINECKLNFRKDFYLESIKDYFILGCGDEQLTIQIIYLNYDSNKISYIILENPFIIKKDDFVNYEFKTFDDYYLFIVAVKKISDENYDYYTDVISISVNGAGLDTITDQYSMFSFYFNSSSDSIKRCEDNCAKCNATSCITKKAEIFTCEKMKCIGHSSLTYKNDGICVSTFSSLLYYIDDTNEKICVSKCPGNMPYQADGNCTGCKICKSSDLDCITCTSSTYYYGIDDSCCVSSCPDNHFKYNDNGKQRCLVNCSLLNLYVKDVSDECVNSCSTNEILFNNTCVNSCPSSNIYIYLNSSFNIC